MLTAATVGGGAAGVAASDAGVGVACILVIDDDSVVCGGHLGWRVTGRELEKITSGSPM